MADKSATSVVDKWVSDSWERTEAVVKQSLQDLTEEIQTPVAKGGRMRVDTGFLRASGQGSLNGMPTGPSRPPDGDEGVNYDDGEAVPNSVVLTIAGMKIGDSFFFGWTANYAKYREAKDAFLRLGVQRFQQIVDATVQRLKQRNGK
jgi:hypothetical protein